jgi:drug/metabolite transporter (DMT)-like permease
MKPLQIILLALNCVGLAGGQLLFKQAANSLHEHGASKHFLIAAFTNVPLILAVILYAGLTVLWVFILSITDLSKAYPFQALTLVLTPLLASFIFNERLGMSFFLGMFAIVAGVVIIAFGMESA